MIVVREPAVLYKAAIMERMRIASDAMWNKNNVFRLGLGLESWLDFVYK